ncbi:MAG: hypothetical protein JRG97_04440 [Deltaproteobacteria bacterium]|nr:hypothetical protein [Deltaproteobacteria bacterium]MBW2051088.1 hypothetical protein [Deltaproteobacteria bacterium]MBW2140307.1 hypothetical protein [Deltaproteobacteria bacterium]MBW2322902.1 hypothetical protein [Deltaproteobacteria bacterium]
MRDLFKKFEEIMMAITFAEAGEHREAREILRRRKAARLRQRPGTRVETPRPRPELRAPLPKD